jgi:cytoskeletal protein RodZ
MSAESEARRRLGEWLRNAREVAGFSIDSISHETKISKNYILSLESGEIEALPGKVFGRGFVKCITRLLKTDGMEGLRLYDACWGQSALVVEESNDEQGVIEVHKTKSVMARIAEPVNTTSPVTQRLIGGGFSPVGEKPRVPRVSKSKTYAQNIRIPAWMVRGVVSPHVRMWVLAVIATLFVGLVFGRWAANHWHKTRLGVQSAMVSSSVSPVVKNSTSQPMGSLPDTNKLIAGLSSKNDPKGAEALLDDVTQVKAISDGAISKTVPSESTKTLSVEDNPLYLPSDSAGTFEQVLELKVSGDVELRLTLDGKKISETTFSPDSYRFTFNERAELYILDASQVDVIYNGRSLGVLGNKGRKRRIFFQAKASSDDFPQ